MSRTRTRPREIEARYYRYEAAFRFALNAIIVIDKRGSIVELNASALEMFGYAQEELVGKNVTNLMPEEYRVLHTQSLLRYLKTGQVSVMGRRIKVMGQRQNGEVFPLELEVHEASSGGKREFVGVLRDITEREDTERELHHRMGNLFSVFLGVINSVDRTGIIDTVGDYREKLVSHIRTLASVYHKLRTHNHVSMPLRELLETFSLPYTPKGHPERIVLRGEDVELQPRLANALGLVVNELTTNSIKYGALRMPEGHVEIDWEVLSVAGNERLRLSWQDLNGSAIAAPQRAGFGTRFMERTVKQLGGEISFAFPPGGMRCTLEIPLAP